jgi:hypothetical protein
VRGGSGAVFLVPGDEVLTHGFEETTCYQPETNEQQAFAGGVGVNPVDENEDPGYDEPEPEQCFDVYKRLVVIALCRDGDVPASLQCRKSRGG